MRKGLWKGRIKLKLCEIVWYFDVYVWDKYLVENILGAIKL
jgi:hypothetical protein